MDDDPNGGGGSPGGDGAPDGTGAEPAGDVERVVIMGAAGRDFHDFNVAFRDREDVEVVAFTQTAGQNVGELDEPPQRRYPPALAGSGYPDGVSIRPEEELEEIVRDEDVDAVYFSYSDVTHEHVMHCASRALAAGADFRVLGPERIWLDCDVPVIAVDAVRTGCGKSQTTRRIAWLLDDRGSSFAIVREPMPYGDLERQRVQRFASMADVEAADVTVEEREEYEQHVENGHVVYGGVDYAAVRDAVQQEADLLLWDGGNNELPFYRPDLHVVLCDATRPGHEVRYHPGETNLRLADVVVINKEDSAAEGAVAEIEANVEAVNSAAEVIHAESRVSVSEEDAALIDGATVLVVEDGPTMTHGGASHGAGLIAAEQEGAARILDARDHAAGSLADVLDRYPQIDRVLPAMGYSDAQLRDLERSIANAPCDVVVSGTPFDLARQVDVDVPIVRVRYDLDERGRGIEEVLAEHAVALGLA